MALGPTSDFVFYVLSLLENYEEGGGGKKWNYVHIKNENNFYEIFFPYDKDIRNETNKHKKDHFFNYT